MQILHGTVKTFTGFTKGIITQINDGSVDVKILSRTENATGTSAAVEYTESGLNRIQAQIEDKSQLIGRYSITLELQLLLRSSELLTM